jgi:hypothetical protein
MSQKLSGFLAITFVGTLIGFFVGLGRVVVLDRYYSFPEMFGFAIGPALFAAFTSALVGFVGGAVKKGAFNTTFYWSCVGLLSLLTFGNNSILVSFFNRY